MTPHEQRILDVFASISRQHQHYCANSGNVFRNTVGLQQDLVQLLPRLAPASPSEDSAPSPVLVDEEFSLETSPWLKDHCPTHTRAVMPFMFMMEYMAAAVVRHRPGFVVVGLSDFEVFRFLLVDDACAVRIEAELDACAVQSECWSVELKRWRNASNDSLSRYETVMRGIVRIAREYPVAKESRFANLRDPREETSWYKESFLGPRFRSVTGGLIGRDGANGLIDVSRVRVPEGIVGPGLLDAAAHLTGPQARRRWFPHACPTGLPRRVDDLRFFSPPPREGRLSALMRVVATDDERFPAVVVQIWQEENLWVSFRLAQVLFPSPIPTACTHEFLKERQYLPGVGFTTQTARVTEYDVLKHAANDRFPHLLRDLYGITPGADAEEVIKQIAIKEHVGQRALVHPSEVFVDGQGNARVNEDETTTTFDLRVESSSTNVRVADAELNSEAAPVILMTGSTGFIGSEVLRRIHAWWPQARVIVLMRGANRQVAKIRMQKLNRELFANENAGRIAGLWVDFDDATLGWTAEEYRGICLRITHIVHCAGNVKFHDSLDALRRANVSTTKAMLRLAHDALRNGNFARLHYVSTFAVAGKMCGRIEEKRLPVARSYNNAYEQTKAEAENLLFEEARVPFSIHRVSAVMGDSQTGWTPHFRVGYLASRAIIEGVLDSIPVDVDTRWDAVTIDYAADALFALLRRPVDCPQTVHHIVSGEDTMLAREWITQIAFQSAEWVAEQSGRSAPPPFESISDFVERWKARIENLPSGEEARADYMKTLLDYFSQTPRVFDDRVTVQHLASLGIQKRTPFTCPEIQAYAKRTRWGAYPEERPPLASDPLERIARDNV